jgi:aspartate/methionine/tyrosine aminotransferase
MSTLAERVGALRPTAVNAILADVREVAAAGTPVVSLMRGEPDLPTPPHIVEAARKALIDGRTNYPDNRGEPPLREAVAARMARDHDLAVDPGTEVLVTTGATLGVQCALLALVGPGDDVLVPDPIYDAYHSVVGLAGAGVRPVLSTITGDRFRLTVSALEAARSAAAKVLLLNTPWNPVGTVLRRDELQAIGDFVLRHGLTLVSDEIYEAIVYDGATHLSPATLSPELRAHGSGQQPVEDLRDDRLARRLHRGAARPDTGDVPGAPAGEPRSGHLRAGRGGRRAGGAAGHGGRDAR